MQAQPELPKGWSFPIEPSEVQQYFPGVDRSIWSVGTTTLNGWNEIRGRCFRIAWERHSFDFPRTLTIWAVPSEHLTEIRKWIDEVVGPKSRAWLQAPEFEDPAWLRGGHALHFFWHPEHNTN